MKTSIVTRNNSKKNLISTFFLLSIILTIYWLPGLKWLEHYTWIKVGISFVAFIIPGASLYGILKKKCSSIGEAVVVGFSFSTLLLTALGLITRYGNLSFNLIKIPFIILGILASGIYLICAQNSWRITMANFLANILDLLPGILITILIALVITNRILSEDDQIYIAYQLFFQRSAHIGFDEIIFGYNQLSPSRFWLVSIPLMQAFLSSITNESALVLSIGYYEPFLGILSSISLYQFARSIGMSGKKASLAIVLQFTLLILLSEYLHPGSPFLHQLGTDKAIAAFIIAPVFFGRFYALFKDFSRANLIIAILMSLCLSTAHPVIFAYAAFIAGLAMLITATRADFFNRVAVIGVILGLGLIPQLVIRTANHPSNAIYSNTGTLAQSEDAKQMISYWGNSKFYGFNFSILKARMLNQPLTTNLIADIFSGYAWLVIPLLSTASSIRLFRKETLATHLLTSMALSVLAWIPLTGWLIGLFFTPWMLERTTWLYPFGMSAVFVLDGIKEYLAIRGSFQWFKSKRFISIAVYLTTLFCAGIIFLYMQEKQVPDFERFGRRSQRYEELAKIGRAHV